MENKDFEKLLTVIKNESFWIKCSNISWGIVIFTFVLMSFFKKYILNIFLPFFLFSIISVVFGLVSEFMKNKLKNKTQSTHAIWKRFAIIQKGLAIFC